MGEGRLRERGHGVARVGFFLHVDHVGLEGVEAKGNRAPFTLENDHERVPAERCRREERRRAGEYHERDLASQDFILPDRGPGKRSGVR